MSEGSSDSESCPSFLTESESEHESNYGEEKEQKEVDYTATAKEIICENVNITTDNALKLNSGYHNMLKVLKNKLEILLAQCQDRQVEIGKQIEEYKSNKKPLVGKARTSGYICGQPYFKDEDLYPGPHNEDYLHRKNVLKEFFPLDMFESTDSNWTVKDKVNILKGVKLQIIEFIERENRLKIKKLGNGLEAERLRLEMESLKKRDVNDLWETVKRFANEYPGQKFEIDWLRISNVEISGRHSVAACVGLWNNYMLPGLVRDAWKADDESTLLDAVQRNGNQDWARIAAEVPGRSPYQCFVHFQTTFSQLAQIKRERWTPEEDARLVKVVDENRIGKNIVWNKVVENMPLRNKIQCYNRYMFTLMRPTKHTKFTPEEDCVILAYVQQCGDDFRFVPPNLLPGRSNRQIWARYNHTLKYVNKHSGWTIEEDMRLMNFIKENLTDEGPRKISWAACSKALGNHSRLSCRTRYYTIEKFLEKNPDATLDDVPRKGKKLSSKVTDENWMKTFIKIRNESNDAQSAEVQEEPSTSGAVQVEKKFKSKRKSKVVESKPSRVFSDTIKCAIKKKFYEKFKYSFHYRFGDQSPAIENNKVFCLNKAVFHLLNCTTNLDRVSVYMDSFTPHEQVLLRSSLSIRLNPGLKNFLQSAVFCFLFPPNYNTLLGLRGVVLNATYPSEPRATNKEDKIELGQTNEASYQYALNTFRNRFRMLFYWTMLLVKQNPAEATFIDADEPPKQEDYPQNSLEQQQIALEQLNKLCQSERLSKVGHTSNPNRPTLNDATVCLEQLEINRRHPSIRQPITPKVQIISVKKITGASSELIPSKPSQLQSSQISSEFTSATVASCSPPVASVPVVPQQPPYQLEYSILPEQVHIFESSAPVYGQPVTLEAEKLPAPMEFVAHITIINPEDLPAVRVPAEPESILPSVESEQTEEKSNGELPLTTEAPTTVEINEMADELYQNKEGGSGTGDGRLEQAEPKLELGDSNREDVEPVMQEVTDQTNSPYESVHSAEIEEIATNQLNLETLAELPPEDVSRTEYETAASETTEETEPKHDPPEVVNTLPLEECPELTNSMDTPESYIDDMETSLDHSRHSLDMELSSITVTADSSGSSSSSDAENSIEQLNSLSSTQVTNVTNVGDFVIQELQETDCLSPKKSDDLDESVLDDVPESESYVEPSASFESSQQDHSSQSLDEPDWNPELCEAPRRTYSRSTHSISRHSDRLKQSLRSPSHAWRWLHVDESNREDVELHRSLWKECDPFRMQFQATQSSEDIPKTELVAPHIDEIIVIDDDEVEIKDEPVDPTEPETENAVDEACIQQIIETASNILQLSKAFKITNPNNDEPAQPAELPVFFEPYSDAQTGSLIVQTPSRVFDEQSNCYYYVDEIQDAPLLIEGTQTSEHYPLEYWSFRHDEHYSENGNTDTIQFETPRRILTPAQDPQTPSSSRTVTPRQSPVQIKTYTARTKPMSKSNMVETLVLQQTCLDSPKIRQPKRPPRDQTKASPQQQHCIQNQALSLLDALFRQPRLTPTRQRPLSPSTSMTSISSCNSELSKRPPSSQRLSVEQPIKKFKVEAEESLSEEQFDVQFNAVDVISMLANDDADMGEDVVDDEENEFLAQLAATPSESSTMPSPIKIEEEERSPNSLSTTQRKVIIQSTAKRRVPRE
ncbi:uncharacterized protein Pbp95 [Ochlerotatus camptorhynchus]|uniref:uncharacterized protein Pbp95 n=1 Tax=Ochlerotatus camptorhynchus TaxID=644619 RepID=UPI0031D5A841